MGELRFEWSERKDRANRRKHRVGFEEAAGVFLDPNAKLYFDPEHSEAEHRYVLLGISLRLRVLVDCHSYREDDEVVRVISSRKADKRERAEYWR